MKTFIVYDLDSQMPVAVGEQVSAETARYCASVATGIFQANLLAEEIDSGKTIEHEPQCWETSVKVFAAVRAAASAHGIREACRDASWTTFTNDIVQFYACDEHAVCSAKRSLALCH